MSRQRRPTRPLLLLQQRPAPLQARFLPPRAVDALLAADLAKLSLDVEPSIVAAPHNLSRSRHVLRVGHRRCVEHHGAEAQLDRLATRLASVAWSRCTTTGTAPLRAKASVASPIGAKSPWLTNSILRDLQYHRGPDALGGSGQGLGVLDAEDVERSQTHARGGRGGKHFGEVCKTHRCFIA